MISKRSTQVLRLAMAIACAGSQWAMAADGVAPGFGLSRFEPAERGSRFLTTDSLDWRMSPSLGIVADYAYRPLVVYRVTPDGQDEVVTVVKNFAVGHVGGSFGFADNFRVGVDLPVVMYADGSATQIGLTQYRSPQRSGLGDLRFGGDWRFFGSASDSFRAGVGARLFLPTGDTAVFGGDGSLRGIVQIQAAGEAFGHLTWSARVGIHMKGRELVYAGGQIGSEAQLGGALAYRGIDGRLTVGPEIAASTTFMNAFSGQSTSVDLMVGAHFDITPNWRIGAGIGRGATVAIGSPSVRGLLGLQWVPSVPVDDAKCEALREELRMDAAQREAAATAERERLAAEALASRLALEHAAQAQADAERFAAERAAADDDEDGVANAADACPSQGGFVNAEPTKNGCPTGAVVNGQLVLDLVRFQTNSDIILSESDTILAKVQSAITKLPADYRYRVEGHTDDRGPAAFNVDLSQRRAKAVVAWLVAHGVAASRFEAAGLGAQRPVVANDSEEHRAQNRRVEFHITNLEVKP